MTLADTAFHHVHVTALCAVYGAHEVVQVCRSVKGRAGCTRKRRVRATDAFVYSRIVVVVVVIALRRRDRDDDDATDRGGGRKAGNTNCADVAMSEAVLL